MSTADALIQIFDDAYFAIVNLVDRTKRVIFDLTDATTGKTVTIKAKHKVNRTLILPDKSGTLETLESGRTAVTTDIIDYEEIEIGVMSMTHSFTLGLINPVQGKSMMMEVEPNGFTMSFPPSVRVLSGKFKPTTTNYVYFHCISAPSTPIYTVTIGQQIA